MMRKALGDTAGQRKRSHSHSTAEAAGLRAAAVGQGLLGNDERSFTGVGVQSVDRVMRVLGQGAAVPHRGLSYIQDLITHCLLVAVVVVVVVMVVVVRQTAAPQKVQEEAEVKRSGVREGGGAGRASSSKEGREVIR